MNGLEHQNRLYSTTAGYYTHGGGARYISPLASGTLFPDLVELHESQHAYLALANRTDGIARLYAPLFDPKVLNGESLSEQHLTTLQKIFETIHKHTIYTHEVIATYISFKLFYSNHSVDYTAARQQLPSFYENVLKDGERAFGTVPEIGPHEPNAIKIALCCAMAAMNIPFSPTSIRLESWKQTIKIIEANSPDKRFKEMIKNLTPYHKNGSPFYELGFRKELENAEIYKILRTIFPMLGFTTYEEHPTYFRELFEILKNEVSNLGYHFMNNKSVMPHPEDSLIERFGAKIDLPGLKDWEPLDLSLIQQDYVTGDLEELIYNANVCSAENRCMFCCIFSLPSNNGELHAFCFPSQYQSPKSELLQISVKTSIDNFVQGLSTLSKSLILKIDERWYSHIAEAMKDTKQTIVVLIHDTTPKHFCNYFSEVAKTQKITFFQYHIAGDRFLALLAYVAQDNYFILVPATRLGIEIFEREASKKSVFHFFSSEEELLSTSGIDRYHLYELIDSCYVGINS